MLMLAIVVLDDEGAGDVGFFGIEIEGAGASEVLREAFEKRRERLVIDIVNVDGVHSGGVAELPDRIRIAVAVVVDDDGGVDVGGFDRSAGSGRPPSSPS